MFHLVNTDPRVVAAHKALEAFLASPGGQQLNESISGPDWKARMAVLPNDVKDAYEAHAVNHVATKRKVVREFRVEHPQDYTSIVDYVFNALDDGR